MKKNFIILSIVAACLISCEQEFIPEPGSEGQKYVVEGYIEAGERPFPPYVILTRTIDFYSELGPDQFSDLFVHNADVRISDGTKEVILPEICFDDLPPELRVQAAEQFGFNADSLEINFCVYVDPLNQLNPHEGGTYNLSINAEGHLITATTTIPKQVPLFDLHFEPPPGQPNDTLASLKASVSDPPGVRNFYRYFSATNGSNYQTGFSSVEEDLFFDGKTFEFVLFNPRTTRADVEPDVFGLYIVGDSISIKWASIDEAHFNFWNTLEFSNANQGPFSSYTRLQSNINGGLGIWGGYNVSYYDLKVEY